MLQPVRTTAPAMAPISLDEAKAHLRIIDDEGEDAYVASLIDVAAQSLDGWSGLLGRALITQSWRAAYPRFRRELRLPLEPVQSLTSIAYTDLAGVAQTLDVADARVLAEGRGPYVRFGVDLPATASEPDAVQITYVAGYGDAAADIPAPIRQAMLLLIGHFYANREDATPVALHETPRAVRSLLAPFRRMSL